MLNEEKTITIPLDEYNRLLESQKQVDELKAENTELYNEHTAFIAGSLLEKQNTVKDTAKEIYQMLKRYFGNSSVVTLHDIQRKIEKMYGVEVE